MSVLGWIVVLYFSGILLLLAEFFAPGAILGILGGICVVASGIWAAYIYPDQAFAIVIGELIGVLITIIAGVMLITKTRLGRGIMLTDELSPEKGYVSDMTDESLLGVEGETYTPLRPVGAILVGDRRIDAVANGTYIDRGVRVRVIEVRGNRVVVEAVQHVAAPADSKH